MSIAGIPARLVGWIETALHRKASDLYLDQDARSLRVSCRVQGVSILLNHEKGEQALRISPAFRHLLGIDRNSCVEADRLLPLPQTKRTVRVAWILTHRGETWTLRLQEDNFPLAVSDLPTCLTDSLRRKKAALHLITGATGSGKSTTLYCLLDSIKQNYGKIITMEDPPERILPGIVQSPIKPNLGWGYPNAIRAILRQDPDLIVIGEIRDQESAAAAIRASLTGHPVLATLHAGKLSEIVPRLISLGLEHWQIEASMGVHVHQKLEPLICILCEGEGCIHCSHTGTKGARSIYRSKPG